MSDQEDKPRVPAQGFGLAIPALPASLDDIAKRDTGGLGQMVGTTIDISTLDGKRQLQKHIDYDAPENDKVNAGWYGTPFDCIAISHRGVMAKRDSEGEVLESPRPLIRTVLESAEGRMLVLSSSYVYEDCRNIAKFQPVINRDHPIRVKLKKGGLADRIVQDWDHPIEPSPNGKPKKGDK